MGEEEHRVMTEENLREKLQVTIERAENLPMVDWSSDPYCECEIIGKPGSAFATGVCWRTTQPVWNTTAALPEYSEGDSLEFVVRDQEDDILGVARLSASQISETG